MPDNFVDLTVTSPPYDNLRDYKGYSFPFDEIELLVSAGGKYDNNMVKGFIRIDTTIDNSWNVINNVEIKSNGEILISEVEIDLKTKSISLC